jgi:hypothetical protein
MIPILIVIILIFFQIPWFLRDKTNINKSVNVISLNTSFFTTLLSLIFIITRNTFYSTLVYTIFIVGLLVDFIYTVVYYPKYADPLLIMIHHPFYIFFSLYVLSINNITLFTLFFLQELPTFVLNIKRYYDIKDINIEYLFGFLFFLFRIIYHIHICYHLQDLILENKVFSGVAALSFILHCYWFYGWFCKNIKKNKKIKKIKKPNKIKKIKK